MWILICTLYARAPGHACAPWYELRTLYGEAKAEGGTLGQPEVGRRCDTLREFLLGIPTAQRLSFVVSTEREN